MLVGRVKAMVRPAPQGPPGNLLYLPTDLKDMSQMILRTKGPDRLPAGYEIVLYISMSDSDKVGVFYVESESSPAHTHTFAATVLLPAQVPGAMEPTQRLTDTHLSYPKEIQWPVSTYFSPVAREGRAFEVRVLLPS